MHRFLLLAMLMGLAACGKRASQPGGVTPGEARALGDAAEMIEAKRLPDSALRPPTAPPAVPPSTTSGK